MDENVDRIIIAINNDDESSDSSSDNESIDRLDDNVEEDENSDCDARVLDFDSY
jgi:hypothetical protein